MNLEQFRYIKEVAQCRSISKAAKQLFLTQPTISNAIHNFEEEVGYKIFRRSNQGVALTEDGERIMDSIEVILNEVQRLRNSEQNSSYMSGDVYVDVSPSICSTIMPRVTIACKQAYPGINVHLKETFPDKSVTALLGGMSTISITSFMGMDSITTLENNLGLRNFEMEPLLRENIILYTSKDCPLVTEEAVSVEDTYAYPWILLQEHSYEENCMALGEDEICPNSIIAFQDKDSVKQAIAANLGIAVLGSSFAGEDDPYVTSGLIHRVRLTDVQMSILHVLVTPKKRKFTVVEHCFLEELRRFYRQLQKKMREESR